MFVILLDMEDDGAGQLNLGEKVEITKDEEDLALCLKLRDHVLLVGEEIVILVSITLLFLICQVIIVVQDIVLAVLPISEREHIIAALDDEEREVEVGQLEIDVADLAACLRRSARARLLLGCVHLLACAALIDRYLELALVLFLL